MRIEGWQRNLAAMWLAQMGSTFAFSFLIPFIPLYVQTMGVKDSAAAAQWGGAIAAAGALSMAAAQPVWGALSDRWGRKPMLLRSMIGNGVVTVAMCFVASPEHLLALRFLQGVVTGTVATATALVATSTPRHRVGYALGVLQMAQFVGSSVGPLVGGVIADAFGFRAAFFVAGISMLLGAPVVMAFVSEDRSQLRTGPARGSIWGETGSLMSIALFPILIGVIFMIQFGIQIVTPVLSLFVAELSGGENAATTAGTIIALTGVSSAISALVVGRFVDRVGQMVVLPLCLLGAAASYFPQAFVNDVWQLLLLRMLLGVFLGGLMPSANALLAMRVPQERRGAAFGLAASASAIANGVGPLSAAGIATQWGLRAVFLATGGMFALACCWVSVGFRRNVVPRPMPEGGVAEAGPRASTRDSTDPGDEG